MVTEVKKNWFRRHWIISIFLGLFILGMFGSLFDSGDNPDITGDVVNEQIKQTSEEDLIQETKGESRNNPLSTNTPVELTMEYGWWREAKVELTIIEVKRGGSAWDMIKEANMFNEEPTQEKEYLLTKIKIRVIETEDDEPYNVESSDFKMVSGNGVVYENPSVVEPKPELDGEVYSGGVIEGWISFEVDKSDLTPLLRIEGTNENTLWIKIETSSDNYKAIDDLDEALEEQRLSEPELESTIEEDSWTDDFDEAMEDLGEALEDLEEQSNIYKKLDECTELSAGEDINIPAIKNEFYMACYQIYYYGGEEALDEYIAELR